MLYTYILKTENCEGESPCTLVNAADAKLQIVTAVVRMVERKWKEKKLNK